MCSKAEIQLIAEEIANREIKQMMPAIKDAVREVIHDELGESARDDVHFARQMRRNARTVKIALLYGLGTAIAGWIAYLLFPIPKGPPG